MITRIVKSTCVALLLLQVTSVGFCQNSTKMPVLNVTFNGTLEQNMANYINGQMVLTDIDGTTVELPAKFRTRGATAQQYMMKPSFNMKLRGEDYTEELDSALLGMRSISSWILDAMAIDRICMRNRVAFDIWNEFSKLPYDTDFGGRNGTEGKFVEVYINGKYYGIYCLSDRINRKLLNLKKVKENGDGSFLMRGVLYKSGTQDIANQNEPSYSEDYRACVIDYHNAWELTYPEDYASIALWAPLQDAFQNGFNANYVKKYFFLENLADYQIHVMALCIEDNWGNKNHFLSIRNMNKNIDDPDPTESDRRRFVITPWDLDTSLGGNYYGAYYDGNYSEWKLTDITKNALYPISPLLGDDTYNAILKQRWLEGRKGAFSIESVKAKLESYRDLFLQSGAWQRMVEHFENEKDRPMYVKDLAKEIELIVKWYEARFHEMDDYFNIADGIEEIAYDQGITRQSYYNLKGQKVSRNNLVAGIYIIDGKKVYIKQ